MIELNLCNEVLENAIGIHRSLEKIEPLNPMDAVAVQAMEDLLQYRAIGTIDECRTAYGRGYNQGTIDRAEEIQKAREYGYAKAIDECIKIIEETAWRDVDMLVESIKQLKEGAE